MAGGGTAPLEGSMTLAFHIFAEPQPYPLWCEKCAATLQFLFIVELQNGFLVTCQGCGDERVIPYTRTMEAA
jgi:hypothetical protein